MSSCTAQRLALAHSTARDLLAAHPGARVHLTGALAHGLAHARSGIDLLLITKDTPPPVTAVHHQGIRVDVTATSLREMNDTRWLLAAFGLPREGSIPAPRTVRGRMDDLTRLRTALLLDGRGTARSVLTSTERKVYAQWALADRLQEAVTLTEDLAGLLGSGQMQSAAVVVGRLGTVIAQAETAAAGQPLLEEKWLPALLGLAASPPTGPLPLPPLAGAGAGSNQWGFADIQRRLISALFTCWGTPSGPPEPLPEPVDTFGWLPLVCNEGFAARFGEEHVPLTGGELLTWADHVTAPAHEHQQAGPDTGTGLVTGLHTDMCKELADLAQRCITGYSDDRPVSASLVRSRLTNALTGAPPVLAVARNGQEMTGWCAVRRPEPGEVRARLWGPVVAPSARRAGLGRRLLQSVVDAAEWPLVTTDVPVDRDGATGFFTRSGWEVLETVTVLHGTPAAGPVDAVTAAGLPELEEYVAMAARRFAGMEVPFAEATLPRWREDARFCPGTLLLDPPTGSLLLALAQWNETGSELLLAEVWAAGADVRRQLISQAHTVAAERKAATVRAVTRQDPADFIACGMRITGRCRTFTLPRGH
ncbi:GNAT family N-acetyltransferase [Streptomyces sp. NPDC015350]|uniref:GNAT family N-acetyltransferase n=1 Tax=Streptomyces sp. NPDC015350 TaxID=3364955 RepID=UPI0036F83CAB